MMILSQLNPIRLRSNSLAKGNENIYFSEEHNILSLLQLLPIGIIATKPTAQL